jgi:hypothetical protein
MRVRIPYDSKNFSFHWRVLEIAHYRFARRGTNPT